MALKRSIVLLGAMVLGLAACDDKKAQNNTPTKPDSTKMEPQTDLSAPAPQKP
jgi:type IV pilus biogenesis protein CpaD/CtpE